MAVSHSRRWATWDLQEWVILVGEPTGAYENLTLCLKGTYENRTVQKFFKNLPNEKIPICE
jgi:hypothetical protein